MQENVVQESDVQESNVQESVVQELGLGKGVFGYERATIKIKDIGFSEPIKIARSQSLQGLTASVKALGVLAPIHVLYVGDERAREGYKYLLLSGLRRVYGALKNKMTEIDANVYTFADPEEGFKKHIPLSLLLSKQEGRTWKEIWELQKILEIEHQATPGVVEYLLNLSGGDAMKLKDVALSGKSNIVDELFVKREALDVVYRKLQRERKEENKLEREDTQSVVSSDMGVSLQSAGTESELTNEGENDARGLSDKEVKELLEMEDTEDLEEEFNELDLGTYEVQQVGQRHALPKELVGSILYRDNYKCHCCGMGSPSLVGILPVHHKIPVHAKGPDDPKNLITLCLNCHTLVHIIEFNKGRFHMPRVEFDKLDESTKKTLRKVLLLAKIAVEADKKAKLSDTAILEATKVLKKHPMPGKVLRENQAGIEAYKKELTKKE